MAEKIGPKCFTNGDEFDFCLTILVFFSDFDYFAELWSEEWRRRSKKVVGNVVGDVEGCFGSGGEVVWEVFGRGWFEGSFVRATVGSFDRASEELYKKNSSGVSA